MDTAQSAWISILGLHDNLLAGALKEVDDDSWLARPNERGNSMAFLSLHVVDVRIYLANYIGLEIESPFSKEIQKAKKAEEINEYPSPVTLNEIWSGLGEPVYKQLEKLDSDWLTEKSKFPFPLPDRTRRGDIHFFVHHEAYHIGQLGILRKQLGLSDLYSAAFAPSA